MTGARCLSASVSAVLSGALLFAASGCLFPAASLPPFDGTVYNGTTSPIGYRAPLLRERAAPPGPVEAYGEACQSGIYLPTSLDGVFLGSKELANAVSPPSVNVAWGDGGVRRAVAQARASVGGAQLYDLRFDLHTTAILGIFHHDCVEVHALAVR